MSCKKKSQYFDPIRLICISDRDRRAMSIVDLIAVHVNNLFRFYAMHRQYVLQKRLRSRTGAAGSTVSPSRATKLCGFRSASRGRWGFVTVWRVLATVRERAAGLWKTVYLSGDLASKNCTNNHVNLCYLSNSH